jgi:hypothetical protein
MEDDGADRVPGSADWDEIAPFRLFAVRGYTLVAVACAVVAILVALLLPGDRPILAIVSIVLAVALVADCYRVDIDPSRRKITIRTLWWGWLERRSATYSLDDIRALRDVFSGYGDGGYRLEFQDGARFSLSGPIDPRLLSLISRAETTTER